MQTVSNLPAIHRKTVKGAFMHEMFTDRYLLYHP